MEFRFLEGSEVEGWLDHCGRVFASVERSYFVRHYYSDPWRDPADILVAVEGGRIMSSVRIFTRQLRLRGQTLAMGGIGEVATAPEGQGQGLAGKLLEMAIERMTARGMAMSVLFGTHSNYKRLGWVNVPQALSVSALPPTVAAAASDGGAAWRLERLTDPADLPALAELHAAYCRDFDGVVVRDDPRYWREWIMADLSEKWLARDKDGRIVGWLAAQARPADDTRPARLVLRDFAASVEPVEVFVPLLGELAAALPGGAAIPEVLYPACVPAGLPVLSTSRDDALMYRLLTPFRLGGAWIETSGQLADCLMESERLPGRGLVFWYIDGF